MRMLKAAWVSEGFRHATAGSDLSHHARGRKQLEREVSAFERMLDGIGRV
jgi:hypothetical protein